MSLRVVSLAGRDNVFGQAVWLLVGDLAEANAWGRERFRKWGAEDERDGMASGIWRVRWTREGERREWAIWMRSFDYGWMDVVTLAHESLHVAISVLGSCGVQLGGAAEEVLAYYQGFLVYAALDVLQAPAAPAYVPH